MKTCLSFNEDWKRERENELISEWEMKQTLVLLVTHFIAVDFYGDLSLRYQLFTSDEYALQLWLVYTVYIYLYIYIYELVVIH